MINISGVPRKPVVLVILDGFGVNPSKRNNGIAEARTPNLDDYFGRYPHTLLQASGAAVGLPDNQMGNSEVGHLTLGSGSIIRQDLVKISDAIKDDNFYHNEVLIQSIKNAVNKNRPVHLLGLVSDGGVHSQIEHLNALIGLCKRYKARPLLHMITDGRDTPPRSAMQYLEPIEKRLIDAGGAIASVTGRFYAMDRDNRWDRTERAWRTLVHSKGRKAASATEAIELAYSLKEDDEFIQPSIMPEFSNIQENDSVIFFNFRKDRPRQLVAALGDEKFRGFDRGNSPVVKVCCMMPYDKRLGMPYAFEPEKPPITLAEVISNVDLAQFHCAETEKYAHVTYFFNGGRTTPHSGENQLLVPSPSVSTYDHKPSMSAKEVADAVIGAISQGKYAFIVVNFANGDMVGHTAKRDAVIEAVETLDKEASRVLEAAENGGYSVILTADHGNCEEMVDPFTGEPHTQHTNYPVPCLIMDDENWQLSAHAGLANVAPTVLELMGLKIPEQMTGQTLLYRKLAGRRPEERKKVRNLKGVA